MESADTHGIEPLDNAPTSVVSEQSAAQKKDEAVVTATTIINDSRMTSPCWSNSPSATTYPMNDDEKPSRRSIVQQAFLKRFLRSGPLLGLAFMVLDMLSIFASLGILAGSNGESVARWTTPPSTYLAIFTAIGNLSLRAAAANGIVIGWWTRSTKGSTLAKLHSDWKSGTSFRGALRSGREMGLLGVACIFTSLVVIDGPLLQRASTVREAPINQPISLDIAISPEIPHGFTGYWHTDAEDSQPNITVSLPFNETLPTVNGSASNLVWSTTNQDVISHVAASWLQTAPLGGVVSGCATTCKATIRAPALFPTSSCVWKQVAVGASGDFNKTIVFELDEAAPLNSQHFLISTNMLVRDQELVNIITGYSKSNDECKGILNYTVCDFAAGIGEYDIVVKDNHIDMESIGLPVFVSWANNTVVNETFDTAILNHISTLGGVVGLVYDQWNSYILNYPYNTTSGVGFTQWGFAATDFELPSSNPECPNWANPHDTVVNSANKLMVYTGAYAARKSKEYLDTNLDPGLKAQYTTTGTAIADHDVFHTNYWWFLGAAVFEFLCIALVAPTYWGWWRLGRAVSFSPLELAKAFQSPLLPNDNSASASEIMKHTKDHPIKYGCIEKDAKGKPSKLAFDKPSVVSPA